MSINLEKRISPDKKGITLAFILSILWSGNPISIKVGLEDAPPLRLGWMRFVLGGIVAILWSLYNKETVKFKKSDVIPLIGTGLLFSVQLGFMNIGQNYTSGGHGVIMITTFPLWASIFSHLFIPNDKLTRFKIFGMIIAYIGVIILFWESISNSSNNYLIGDLLMLTSAMLLGARQIYISQISQGLNQAEIKILYTQALVGTFTFFIFSQLFENSNFSISYNLVIALLYQGVIIAGFGFIGQTWLMKKYLPSRILIINISQPVFGVILAWVVLGEIPGFELVFATIFVLSGSYLAFKNRQ